MYNQNLAALATVTQVAAESLRSVARAIRAVIDDPQALRSTRAIAVSLATVELKASFAVVDTMADSFAIACIASVAAGPAEPADLEGLTTREVAFDLDDPADDDNDMSYEEAEKRHALLTEIGQVVERYFPVGE